MPNPSLSGSGLGDTARNFAVLRSGLSGLQPGSASGNGEHMVPVPGRGGFARVLARQDQVESDGEETSGPARTASEAEGRKTDRETVQGRGDDTSAADRPERTQAHGPDSGVDQEEQVPASAGDDAEAASAKTGQGSGQKAEKTAQGEGPRQQDDSAASAGVQALSLAAFASVPQFLTAPRAGGKNDATDPAMAGEEGTSSGAISARQGSASMVIGDMQAESLAATLHGVGSGSTAQGSVATGTEGVALAGKGRRDTGVSDTALPASLMVGLGSDAVMQRSHADNAAPIPVTVQKDGGIVSLMGHSATQSVAHEGASGAAKSISIQQGIGRRLAGIMPAKAGDALPAGLAVQGGAGWAAPYVRMMSFQSATAGTGMAGRGIGGSSAVAGAKNVVSPAEGRGDGRGQPDSLFTLMMKVSAQGEGGAFAHSDGQGGGQNGGQAGAVGMVASHEEDSNGVLTGSAAFAGVLAGMEGGHASRQESISADGPSHAGEAGTLHGMASLMQVGRAPNLSSGIGGVAGVLNMTVLTQDATPVHVQLNHSAEGGTALSLQGGDEGTTELLEKTHHVLARQLDEVGLHAGVMKIDVLPAEPGQMAGGQDMPRHQGQEQHQGSGQNFVPDQGDGQAASRQGGGFLAGGDGGSGQGQRDPRQGGYAPAQPVMQPVGAGELLTEEAPSHLRSRMGGNQPGRTGRLNISV